MQKSRKRQVGLGNLEREILERLSAGDLLIGFLCSAMSTKTLFKTAQARAKRRYIAQLAVNRLISNGHINLSGGHLSISNSGKTLNTKALVFRNQLANRKWDEKWRVVIFDIPEDLGHLRRQVRTILKRAGFQKLQQSVWVYPHDCLELTTLIKQDPRVKTHVLYGVFESIENDAELRRKFQLK